MKKLIILVLAITVIACKKSKVTPDPVHAPTCEEKATKKFEGKFISTFAPNDTLTIVFKNTSCPSKENANVYTAKNFFNCVKTLTVSAGIQNRDYQAFSDELYPCLYTSGTGYLAIDNVFTIAINNAGKIYMTCNYCSPSLIYFTKL